MEENFNEEQATGNYNSNIPVQIRNISIENVADYFSPKALKLFNELGIMNLEQLLEFPKKSDFIVYFGNSNMFDEVSNTIRILRSKYLNEAPLIDISDENLVSAELYKLLGLSVRSCNALLRNGFCENAKQFFEKMISGDGQYELCNGKSIGNISINEIRIKSNIIIEYYENKKLIEDSKKGISLSETLESLKKELQELMEERERIDKLIDIILARIQEKSLTQTKGGASK